MSTPQDAKVWQPDVAMAIKACRDFNLSDGAVRFAVLACLVEQPPLSEDELEWARKVIAKIEPK